MAYNDFMSTRRAKQIIYGMLYLILWGVFFFAVYGVVHLFAPSAPAQPACTSNCMPVGASSIATSSVRAFLSSPGHYTFLTQVQNTNPDYAASYFNYAIDLYDASGTVLQSIPETSFIYGGETKYLVVPNVSVAEPFASAGLTVSDPYWQPMSALGVTPAFSTVNVTAGGSSSTVTVAGQLTNSNISATRYVIVDVIFQGPDGSPAGASQTEIDDVAPRQAVNFGVSYPQTGSIDPSAASVLVYGLK